MTRVFPLLSAATALCLLVGAAAGAQELTLDPTRAVDAQGEADTGTSTGASAAGQAAAAAEEAAQTPATQPAPQQQPHGYLIRDVAFTGPSAYLTEAELAQIEAGLVGRRYAMSGLAAIPQAINQAYADRGITTAQAVLRRVDGGQATVELLEARVGAVSAGPGLISADYLRFRMAQLPGALADNRVLDRRLQQVALTDNLPLQLAYAPGDSYGTTNVTVLQPDQPRHQTVVTLDNYGSASSGRPQLTFAHTVRSLTGWNDPLSLTLQLREGSVGGTVAYSRVITPGGGFVGLSLAYSDTKDVTGAPLTGEQSSLDLSYTQPLVVDPARRSSLTFGLSLFQETARLAGVQTLGHKGVELSLGASFYRGAETWSYTIVPRLIVGRYDDAVTPRSGIRYAAIQANIFGSVAVGDDLVASITAGGQASLSGVMPSQRKFTVTSPSAVRGYPTSLSSGDSGYFLRGQIEKLTPYDLGNQVGLRPFGFLDMGEAFDSTGAGLGRAAAIGVGVSLSVGRQVFGDIYIAKPLTTGITGWANPSKDPVIGVSVSFTF